MLFGTFDFLHKGHLNFFKQARKLSKNPYLIVSVARDLNVKRIKGRKPDILEKQRLAKIKKCPLVNKAVLGGVKNYLPHIIKENPSIIALGYDQRAYVKNLKILLAKKGLKVKIARLKPYHPKIYKSSLVKRGNSAIIKEC
jgi:FAD synthetase